MRVPLTIRKLRMGDEKAFLEAYHEFKTSDNFKFVVHYKEGMPFSDFLEVLKDQEEGRNLPERFVPSTFLFGFVGEKMVGRVMIRHQLNEFLQELGGHIGYGVVPSERGKGFATLLLKEALTFARNQGLEEVLLTCHEDNNASKKIIEKSGGVYEGLTDEKEGEPRMCRYWVSTTHMS